MFGIKLVGKSSFPPVKDVPITEQGSFILEISDQIIDMNISRMDHTLVEKFLGARPNIEVVRVFVKRKWALKGQVDIAAMSKGCFSFCLSCKEDRRNILCGVPLLVGKHSMILHK